MRTEGSGLIARARARLQQADMNATQKKNPRKRRDIRTIHRTSINARGWIRTNDIRFRRPMLYPAELRMQYSEGF